MFSPETHKRLKLHAFQSDRTLIEIIDEAVRLWLEENDPKSANIK